MPESSDKVYHANLDSAGRIVLPAELRHALKLERGDRVVIAPDINGFHIIKTLSQVVKEAQDFFCRYKHEDESIVDELLQERRQESARE